MPNFLYYLPNVRSFSKRLLPERKLDSFFEDVPIATRKICNGPGGEDGVMICRGDDTSQLYFKPDEQEWVESPERKCWVGLSKERPPDAADLTRKKQMPGHWVRLGNNEEWLIPVARFFSGVSALPQALLLSDSGEVTGENLQDYAEFGRRAEDVWADFVIENKFKNGETKLTIADRLKIAIEALGWNYFVGREEVNLLRLLTTQNVGDVLAAIIDIHTLKEMADRLEQGQKKTSGPTSSAGT